MREVLIYIVDDDDAVRDSIEVLLETHGFTVLGFSSGSAFLDHPRPQRQSCLVLDVEMPGLSGLEVLRRVCGDRLIAFTLVMTARPTPIIRATVERVGATLFEKPFVANHLITAIFDGLRGSRLQ